MNKAELLDKINALPVPRTEGDRYRAYCRAAVQLREAAPWELQDWLSRELADHFRI